MSDAIDVLDNGYVRVCEENGQALVLGSDLTVVNAARASFEKESVKFGTSDKKLLKFLYDRNEFSPFRHAQMSFEVYAPLMVARQWLTGV